MFKNKKCCPTFWGGGGQWCIYSSQEQGSVVQDNLEWHKTEVYVSEEANGWAPLLFPSRQMAQDWLDGYTEEESPKRPLIHCPLY